MNNLYYNNFIFLEKDIGYQLVMVRYNIFKILNQFFSAILQKQ